MFSDVLSGKAKLSDVLIKSSARRSSQRQTFKKNNLGRVEDIIPEISTSNDGAEAKDEFAPVPPIVREEKSQQKKILTITEQHSMLNGFQMFLALSDRLFRTEGEFFNYPHTTKMMWGKHRIIYIFGDATGTLNLYYDIELREPLASDDAGGSVFHTTTIVTPDRIFVPVPKHLERAFQVDEEAKEFFVRFDTIA